MPRIRIAAVARLADAVLTNGLTNRRHEIVVGRVTNCAEVCLGRLRVGLSCLKACHRCETGLMRANESGQFEKKKNQTLTVHSDCGERAASQQRLDLLNAIGSSPPV